MKINIITADKTNLATIESDHIIINNTQDAVDLMMNASYQGAFKLIVKAEQLNPDFFDLKTGIAGDILQKFSTYNMQLAILGDFSIYTSKSLRDFIFESNRVGRILFVTTLQEAQEKWGI